MIEFEKLLPGPEQHCRFVERYDPRRDVGHICLAERVDLNSHELDEWWNIETGAPDSDRHIRTRRDKFATIRAEQQRRRIGLLENSAQRSQSHVPDANSCGIGARQPLVVRTDGQRRYRLNVPLSPLGILELTKLLSARSIPHRYGP